MERSRRWQFTLNNYTDGDREAIHGSVVSASSYLCYQPELSPTCATPHLQGYVEFPNPRVLGGVKRLFGPANRVHLEVAQADAEKNIEYCSKPESRDDSKEFGFTEFGKRPDGQGSRTDLVELGKRLREGEEVAIIAQDFPGDFIRYSGGILKYAALFSKVRSVRTIGHWFWGPTGCGKSYAARVEFPSAYWKSPEHLWWENYDGSSAVVIDDYRCCFCKFAYLLRLVDDTPLQVNVKGTSCNFASEHVIITAPKPPWEMWGGRTAEDLSQLARRFPDVREFNTRHESVEFTEWPKPSAMLITPN